MSGTEIMYVDFKKRKLDGVEGVEHDERQALKDRIAKLGLNEQKARQLGHQKDANRIRKEMIDAFKEMHASTEEIVEIFAMTRQMEETATIGSTTLTLITVNGGE